MPFEGTVSRESITVSYHIEQVEPNWKEMKVGMEREPVVEYETVNDTYTTADCPWESLITVISKLPLIRFTLIFY